jgi:hypothetical protein
MEGAGLPGLIVYTNSEAVDLDATSSGRHLVRVLDVVVEGYVKATSNSDDTVDTIAAEVETALANDSTINSLAKDSILATTEVELSGDSRGQQSTGNAEKPIAVVRMTFTVVYVTADNAPGTAL